MDVENINRDSAPKNIAEFLEQGWGKKIINRIRKFTLKDVLNSQEELQQDVILSLIDTDYLSRFDPNNTRNFEVYIYVFIDNFLKRKYVKEHTRNGFGIVNRASLEPSLPENETDFSKDVIYLETLQSAVIEEEQDVFYKEAIEKVRVELKQFKASSSVLYNGLELQRDPSTVFELILQDRSIADIADMFQTSKQFVYNLLKKIRDTKSMKQFKSEYIP